MILTGCLGDGPVLRLEFLVLELLDDAARLELAAWGRPDIRNYRGTVTGDVHGVVVLDKLDA